MALPIQPKTPAGKVAYQAQVAKWSAQNGDRPVNKMRPYPLSPGTLPVASGECWKCRYTGHHGPDCPDPNLVLVIEQKWRSIAATISRCTGSTAAMVAVNLVTEDGTYIDQAEYDAHVIEDYLACSSGKRQRVIGVKVMVATPLMTQDECEVGATVHELQMAELGDTKSTSTGQTEVGKGNRVDVSTNLYVPDSEKAIFDLYCIGYGEGSAKSIPFMHMVCLMGPRGEVVQIQSVFDDGVMLNAIDAGMFEMVKGRLNELTASLKILRMADGHLVPSLGVWMGEVEVKGLRQGGSFEVFDSGGAWVLLFRKPLLTAFNAFHGYGLNKVHIPSDDGAWVTLSNQFFSAGMQVVNEPFIGFTTDIKQCTSLVSEHLGSASTSMSVLDGPLTSMGAPT